MRFDFSTRSFEFIEIDVDELLEKTKSNLLFLLKQNSLPFDLEIVTRNEKGEFQKIKKINLDRQNVYSYLLKCDQIHVDGGALSYRLNEYWELDSEKPYFEFSTLDIKENAESSKGVVAISLVLAAATILHSSEIWDVNEVLFQGLKEGCLEIERVLTLAVDEGDEYFKSLKKFYDKTLIGKNL
ncbi:MULTISPECIES: hypothetical protein [unclassified Variovorax]|uniref:hypothetical protein n=1 Tax=Variovorax atrisoli TaxID=3394203 RepID=UPI0016207424|nr:hypothetical protein [Variovorax sp. BK613]MBB3643488.1 hypothetical protein [Variovorax sp. BK613]